MRTSVTDKKRFLAYDFELFAILALDCTRPLEALEFNKEYDLFRIRTCTCTGSWVPVRLTCFLARDRHGGRR
jgi:hypothetical protein